jgi:hypothetical protein
MIVNNVALEDYADEIARRLSVRGKLLTDDERRRHRELSVCDGILSHGAATEAEIREWEILNWAYKAEHGQGVGVRP